MNRNLKENLGLKVSAVVLAIILWLFVTSRGQTEMSVEAPLEYKGVPSDLAIFNHIPKSVLVTLRGQERIMKNIKAADVRVIVDMSKAKKGDGTFYLSKDDVKLPYAVSVMNLNPSSIRLRLEETDSARLMVRPVITGEPERGYVLKSVEVSPDHITVRGVKTELRKLHDVPTEPLDISGLRATISQELNVLVSGTTLKSDTASVKVAIVINRRQK